MRSQVSAELLIVIAALAALAIYVFNQMRVSSQRMAQKYRSLESNVEGIINELVNK